MGVVVRLLVGHVLAAKFMVCSHRVYTECNSANSKILTRIRLESDVGQWDSRSGVFRLLEGGGGNPTHSESDML